MPAPSPFQGNWAPRWEGSRENPTGTWGGVGRLHQGRAGHPLALFRNLGVCGGRKRITQPQHVTSGRRSQVGRHPSRKGCRVQGFRASPREETSMWTRPAGSAASGLRGWWAAPGPISGSQGSTSRCPPAGGRAVNCPARRLPPRPPASCGGRGRHVVGLRRRRGARAAVTGCATGSLSAAWRRSRRGGGGCRAGLPASARARAVGAEGRRVALWRAGGAAGAPGGWSGCPGCGRARGRCGRHRVRRGEARGSGWEAAARPARRGRALGSPGGPRTRPLAVLAAPGGNLRPRVPAPAARPGRTARSRGRAASSQRPNPGPRPRPLLAGADAAAGPIAFGVRAEANQPWGAPARFLGAPFYFHRVGFPPWQWLVRNVRWAASQCVKVARVTRGQWADALSPPLSLNQSWEMLQFEFSVIDFQGIQEARRAVISWTRVKVDCFYNSFWRRLHVYSEWVNRGWNADGCAFCKKMMYLDLLILCVIVEWLLMASMLHLRLVLIRNIFDIILCDRN